MADPAGSSNQVICHPIVRAEAGVRPATAFLGGEGAVATAGTIHVHGKKIRWGGMGGEGGGTVRGNRGDARRGVRGPMGARKGCSRLILLDRTRCCQVGLECSG